MPTIIDQVALSVQANSATWLQGPVVEEGQTFGIQVLPNNDGTHYVSLGPPPPAYQPVYVPTGFIPDPTTILQTSTVHGNAAIIFLDVIAATTYYVYRGTSSGSETLLDTGVVTRDAYGNIVSIAWGTAGTIPGDFYLDATVADGTIYYYYIVAGNSHGSAAASPEVSIAVVNQTPNSTFVGYTGPANMIGGYSYTVSFSFTNTGTKPWTKAALTRVKPTLAGYGSTRFFLDNATYNNGGTAVFTGVFVAPTTPGTYDIAPQCITEGIAAFGAVGSASITVAAVPNMLGFPEGVEYQRTTDSAIPVTPEAYLSGDWLTYPPSQFPAANLAPGCLAIYIGADGTQPPASNALRCVLGGRNALYTEDQLVAISGVPGAKRLWLIVNDALSHFSDNTGTFSVIITRYASVNPMANEPLLSILRPQFGVEPTFGGTVVASRMLCNVENSGFDLKPEQTKEAVGTAGFAFNTGESTTTAMSKGTIKGMFDYRDIGYFFASTYGPSVDSVLASSGGVTAYQHIFEDQPWVPIPAQTYYFEFVKEAVQRAYSAAKLMFTGFKIDTARDKQATLSVNALAGVLKDGITPSTGANDSQTLTFNNVSGGTWGLQLDNLTLSNLLTSITPANLQIAIRALGAPWTLATVSGSAGVSYVITNVTGALIQTLIPIYVDGNGNNTLTGTGPTITCAHTVQGGMALHDFQRILPSQVGVTFSDTLADLINAGTALVNEFSTDIDVADRFDPVWRQNPSDVGHGAFVQKKAADLKDSIKFTLAYDSQVATWVTNSQSDVKMFTRLKFIGNPIGTTGQSFTLYYDACIIPTWDSFSDSAGNIHSASFMGNIVHDIPSGFRSRWTLINDVANYAS